jgi:hypothetical protein
VQAPYFSQSLNRFSYVSNNPLSFIDPSGFTIEEVTTVGTRGDGGGGGGQPGVSIGGGPTSAQQNGPIEAHGLEFVEVVASRILALGVRSPNSNATTSPSGEIRETIEEVTVKAEKYKPCSGIAEAIENFTGGASDQALWTMWRTILSKPPTLVLRM